VNDTASPPAGGGGSSDSWEAYLERTPVEDMEREKLLLLLNRNEWNIARVARMMGVTRRHGVPAACSATTSRASACPSPA